MQDPFEDKQGREEGGFFDVNFFLSKLLANYIWIISTILIALFGAFIYLRYATPKYQISSYILVGGGALESNANSILTDVGLVSSLDNSLAAVSNEIFILQSNNLNGKVVDSLKLNVVVSKLGRFKNQPLLKESLPVDILVKKSTVDRNSPQYTMTLHEDGFSLDDNGNLINGEYGTSLIIHGDTIKLEKKPGISLNGDAYLLQFASRKSTIAKYISQLSVVPSKNGGAGLLKVSVIEELPERAERYIEVLIHSYNVSYLDYKHQAIRRALAFLGQRLETVSKELNEQENDIRDFKAKNQLYDVSSTAGELLDNLQTLDAEVSQNDLQNELLMMVENSIKRSAGNEEIIATTNGLVDPVLNTQVQQYNELVLRKQTIESTGAEADPRLGLVSDQLTAIRNNILLNISNIRKQFSAGDSHLSALESKYSDRFQQLPQKEKEYIELNRKVSIKESQYLYLLQKKEETDLQLVSSDDERSRTVDDVMNEGQVSPNALTVYALALIIGAIIPCILILLRVLLNKKIETRKEIENATNVPILGELSLSPSKEPIVISKNNRTAIAEQLRLIRTNLSFIAANDDDKVFVVTSSRSGEGKSFVSLNLGNSLAIGNHKVAILELDLRKPMLSRKLGISPSAGLSNYIVDHSLQPEDIIQPLNSYPNLFLLSSGAIPPNPGELIIHPRMAELVNHLRDSFDYIILDSPPVGLVADALSLAKLADLSLFVIRPNYSFRDSLSLVDSLKKEVKFPKLTLIVNGIQAQKGYAGYNSFGYGYGYYTDDSIKDEPGFIRYLKRLAKSK